MNVPIKKSAMATSRIPNNTSWTCRECHNLLLIIHSVMKLARNKQQHIIAMCYNTFASQSRPMRAIPNNKITSMIPTTLMSLILNPVNEPPVVCSWISITTTRSRKVNKAYHLRILLNQPQSLQSLPHTVLQQQHWLKKILFQLHHLYMVSPEKWRDRLWHILYALSNALPVRKGKFPSISTTCKHCAPVCPGQILT